MFRNWGFLLGEIWVLITLAALLGLFAGWLIWGRRSVTLAPVNTAVTTAVNSGEADRLRLQLGECESRARAQAARITTLEREATAPVLPAVTAAPIMAAPTVAAPMPAAPVEAAPVMVAAAPLAEIAADPLPPQNDGTPRRPEALSAARDGGPDDLKLIKGVGPKLEALLHSLGFYHFDQLAHWTAAEIAWVDENLEGFKGRVTRDDWVQQARDLAKGLPPRPGGEG